MSIETRTLDPPPAEAPPPGDGPGALALRANKLELLERLADDLAHEIKNPLHSMVINLEVLKRRMSRVEAAGQEDVLRYIGVLSGELERVNRRIELLLRLSRPPRGAETTTLVELTDELMELIRLEARHHELQVDYRPEGRIARVFVQRESTRQVILNLVLEVIDRLASGGTLRIGIREREGRSRILVGDSGDAVAALDPAEVAAEVATHPAGRLGVAFALAEAVGGRVELDPAAEDGPSLVFSLPVARGGA
ncbi:MAG TPA: histidine kinase dimerization/phospho-acceptor domain-containing protein [Longimicrobium sp.]|nr:histidine kinase dimerization/phospho-acceptor domain-containing protein [Longimicrobium sp.]